MAGVGGCGACSWVLGGQHRALVHSTGPLGPVGGGMGGYPRRCPVTDVVVVARHRGLWWVAAWSLHKVSVTLFCTMPGPSLADGGRDRKSVV